MKATLKMSEAYVKKMGLKAHEKQGVELIKGSIDLTMKGLLEVPSMKIERVREWDDVDGLDQKYFMYVGMSPVSEAVLYFQVYNDGSWIAAVQ